MGDKIIILLGTFRHIDFYIKMMKKIIIISIFLSVLLPQEFQIARVQYGGGGDWYSDPSSLPNLLNYLKTVF